MTTSPCRRGSLAVAVVLALLASFVPSDASSAWTSARRTSSVPPLEDRVEFGAYADGMQADPSRLRSLEWKVGRRTDIASYYYGFGDVFPVAPERLFADGGRRKVLVSWDMGPTRFSEWSGGRHDAYLDQIAAAANSHPYPLYVRPWPEMNGDWQTFQPTAGGSRPHAGTYAQFKTAWRYVVTYLRSRGADNLKWVFNPTTDTYAETTAVSAIWPGTAYVDVLGLDGFNWGRDAGWGRWRSFADIYTAQYRNLTALHPTAPVWICEISSKEPTVRDGAPVDSVNDKGAWVRAMLADRTMPRVKALIWFHAKKERDWRVDSSSSSLSALRRGLAP